MQLDLEEKKVIVLALQMILGLRLGMWAETWWQVLALCSSLMIPKKNLGYLNKYLRPGSGQMHNKVPPATVHFQCQERLLLWWFLQASIHIHLCPLVKKKKKNSGHLSMANDPDSTWVWWLFNVFGWLGIVQWHSDTWYSHIKDLFESLNLKHININIKYSGTCYSCSTSTWWGIFGCYLCNHSSKGVITSFLCGLLHENKKVETGCLQHCWQFQIKWI